ncbi:MAG: hypothetical protein NTY38_24860 [Acidobacteria bacterium]|nr:hypothetical protein [Acidobacteriota bacterium]
MDRDYLLSITVVAVVFLLIGCPRPKRDDKAAAPPKPPPRITQFYASPTAVAPGEPALLCYGVENAAEVRMVPPVANVKPVLSRCVPVTLSQTATFTLTASSEQGQSTAAVTITVDRRTKPAAAANPASEKPASLSFFADRQAVASGQPVLLCYQAGAASKVDLQPRSASVALPATGCVTERPTETTRYVLTAEFADGRREKQELKIRVE